MVRSYPVEHPLHGERADEDPRRRLAGALCEISYDPVSVAASGRADLVPRAEEAVVPIEREVVVVACRERVLVDPGPDVPDFHRIRHNGAAEPRKPALVARVIDLKHAAVRAQRVREGGLSGRGLVGDVVVALHRRTRYGPGIRVAGVRA